MGLAGPNLPLLPPPATLHGSGISEMALELLLVLGVVLAVTVAAFALSAMIGMFVGRVGLEELDDDSRHAQPVTLGQRQLG